MLDFFIKLLPAIITGLFLYYWQRAQEKRDRTNTKKDELRDKIEQVDREINNATMELAYATAVAVECGKTNGELKRAKEAYNAAVQHQTELGQELIKEQVR